MLVLNQEILINLELSHACNLDCNEKHAFFTSEQPKRYIFMVMSTSLRSSPLSFGQYIYKIWLEIL